MTTPNLQLPEPPDFATPIAAEERDGQRALDALGPGWIAVLSATVATPPAAAPQGARYIVPLAATGAWATHARHVAYMTPIGWAYRAPRAGWVALVLDQGDLGRAYIYNGTDWALMPIGAFNLLLDATDITFDGYGLPTDPATIDAALDFLFAAEIDHETRITALEGGGGGGGSSDTGVTPDTFPVSANAMDDEFEAGTLDAKWTWRNQNAATITFSQGAAILTSTTGADKMSMVTQAAPSTPWKVRVKIHALLTGNFAHCGIGVFNSGNGRAIEYAFQFNGGMQSGCFRYSDLNTFNSTVTPSQVWPTAGGHGFAWYLEIENDGTTLTFRYSLSGFEGTFIAFTTEALATYIGAVTDVGLSTNPGAGPAARSQYEWFRRIS